MQRVTNQKLAYKKQSISGQFLRSQEKEAEAQREVEALKKAQEELRANITKEIEELKREQDWIVFEKA